MSKVKIEGNASGTGTLTISAPNTDTDRSITLPDGAGEIFVGDITSSDLPAGSMLQMVRATQNYVSGTSSTSFTDVGLSVTITPQKSDSRILIQSNFFTRVFSNSSNLVIGYFKITDSSNNALSGAEAPRAGTYRYDYSSGYGNFYAHMHLIGYATPGVTTAVTYKLRFASADANSSVNVEGGDNTAQMYAIEVAS